MNTSPHTHNDKLQALFDALPQPAVSGGFEQETMRRVYLAAQKKHQVAEQKWAVRSTLEAAAMAACITAIVVGGFIWLNGQQSAIAQFFQLQKVNIAQSLQSLDPQYLWAPVIGVLIWLMSSVKSHQHSHQ